MVYTYKEIFEKYKNDYQIKKALEEKKIFKLENGVYSDKILADPIVIYSVKYPNAIVTMDSALYYYGLTDVIPDKVYLATNRYTRPIRNNNIHQLFVEKRFFEQGKIQINVNGNLINIYDKERLLVEFIRKRANIPYDYYKEVIYSYRNIIEELNVYKIEEYSSLFKNNLNLFDIIRKEIF